MSSSVADDGTALPPSPRRKFSPNGSRAEQILASVQSTPLSNHAPTVDPATKTDHLAAHFDRYIEEDLREHVFIHAEDFFPTILHLPDWKTDDEISKKTKAIRDDPVFKQHMKTYVDLCDERNPGVKSFYHPYGMMCANDYSGVGIYRQDAKPVIGSEEELIPDTLGVLRAMFTSSGNDADKMKGNGPEHNFSCAQTIHWQEFKTKVSLLDEGTEVRYRVLSDVREDPQGKVRVKNTVRRDPGSILPPVRSSHPESASKKRRSEKEPPSGRTKYARSRTTPDVSDARKGSGNSAALNSLRDGVLALDGQTAEEDEHKARREVMLQCGRYALEILSNAGFRTHCLGALIVAGRIQLLYYDRSIIIVCKPIHMFKRGPESSRKTITLPDITDEFGALLVGLSRLTLEQRGIQEQLCVDRALIENYKTCMTRCGKAGEAFDQRDIFKGVKLPLNLKSDKGDEKVEVMLGRIISRQPAIIGRHTCVVEAKSDYKEWRDKELVIKISWPAIKRQLEAELVKVAREKARMMKTGKKPDWALDHLPDILLCQDFGYDAKSTQANIATFLEKAKCAEKETLDYERRVCRITVQERLYPLEELQTVEEYAQVFFDILQIHKWLYDHPRILHRDISPGNIMWRRTIDAHRNFAIHGISTPRQRQEREILRTTFIDMIFAVTPAPETLPRQKVHSPFDRWYNLSRAQLKTEKGDFLMGDDSSSPTANSGFTNFQPWIRSLHKLFMKGLNSRKQYYLFHEEETDDFDDETLQGWVSYSSIVNTCGKFAGSSLEVRNDQFEGAV
ncbi:hypothetical protein EDD18DRAFT_1330939 [Armillaria luteobubalina]|uniref:Fungal-type protein kinase domain-containing protein n=1 Tax=Armillaria luteobubalina TaxID=153913 RepID=A0AA39Q7R3_9AGAR|nr:hypothetical protein EDD18DRAFT_1330939 [Armillaria luteobubalina]